MKKINPFVIAAVFGGGYLIYTSSRKNKQLEQEAERTAAIAAEAARVAQETAAKANATKAQKQSAAQLAAIAAEKAKKTAAAAAAASELIKAALSKKAVTRAAEMVKQFKEKPFSQIYINKTISIPEVVKDIKGALIYNGKILNLIKNTTYTRGKLSIIGHTTQGKILLNSGGKIYKIDPFDFNLI